MFDKSETLINSALTNSNGNLDSFMNIPTTKPFVIVDHDCKILAKNFSFDFLKIHDESSDELSIASDPNLNEIVTNFSHHDYKSVSLEIIVSINDTPVTYPIDMDKISFHSEEAILIRLTNPSENKLFEDKIINFHNTFEFGNVPVLITDNDGVIKYSSSSFEDILGLGIERIFNKHLTEIFSGILPEEIDERLRIALSKKVDWVYLMSGKDAQDEPWFKELHLRPVYHVDEDDFNFIVTANDITNYILKNRIIEESEQRQRTIINNISDPLMILRKENNDILFESANENFYSTFDVSSKSKEKHLYSVVNHKFYDVLLNSIVHVDNNIGDYVSFRYTDPKNNREYEGKLAHIRDFFKKTTLYVISFVDITDHLNKEEKLRAAFEKENQLNKLKSTFLANMSHEVRTPLNAIVGYSDLIEDDVKTEYYDSLPELTTYMKEGVKRLLTLVDNIVEMAKLESGTQSLDIEVTNINHILKSIINLYLPKMEQVNINFENQISDDEYYIKTDEYKFQKIMDVLLDNAIKYCEADGRIRVESQLYDNSCVIRISDTGIGIEKEKLKNILEPFSQVETDGYKRNYEGAGLGLTIAHRITTMLDGKLDIQSEPGLGTNVILEFPICKKPA